MGVLGIASSRRFEEGMTGIVGTARCSERLRIAPQAIDTTDKPARSLDGRDDAGADASFGSGVRRERPKVELLSFHARRTFIATGFGFADHDGPSRRVEARDLSDGDGRTAGRQSVRSRTHSPGRPRASNRR
jgi:hypothetical protein